MCQSCSRLFTVLAPIAWCECCFIVYSTRFDYSPCPEKYNFFCVVFVDSVQFKYVKVLARKRSIECMIAWASSDRGAPWWLLNGIGSFFDGIHKVYTCVSMLFQSKEQGFNNKTRKPISITNGVICNDKMCDIYSPLKSIHEKSFESEFSVLLLIPFVSFRSSSV